MKCVECGKQTTREAATPESPYHFTASGLDSVYLAGIVVEKCKSCGATYPIIPRIEELHRTIASVLARKESLLAGDEVRFIRKVAGFPASKFAALLMIDPSTLSRVENGHQDLGAVSDKLARAVAMAAINLDAAKEILTQIAEKLEATRQARLPVFRFQKTWTVAA